MAGGDCRTALATPGLLITDECTDSVNDSQHKWDAIFVLKIQIYKSHQ